MGKKKVTSTTTNQAPQFVAPPVSPYFKNAEKLLENIDYQSSVLQNFGKLQNQINESGNEAFGADTPAEVRDRIRQSRLFRATTDHGRNMLDAVQAETAAKNAGYMSLGGATAPVAWSPGRTQTQTQSGGFGNILGSIITGGAQVGAAAAA